MIGTERHPDLRVRIKHCQTAKGWRLDETTVEISYDLGAEGQRSYMRHLLQTELANAHEDGTQEAIRRNLRDDHDV